MTLLQLVGVQDPMLSPSGGCHNCPRRRVDFVPATLRDGSVLWLGEAPGATEVERQEGFTGASGQLLREEAAAAGVPEPWSFSNAVHCRPPANADPKPKEVQCCLSQYVLGEVARYPVVVLVGLVPLQALFPGAKATHFRGNVAWHPDFPGQRFYAIYHPAYVLRRPDLRGELQRQLARLGRLVREQAWTPDVRVVTAGGGALVATVRKLVQEPCLSLDLETTGLASWHPHARVTSLGVSADGRTVAAVHEHDAEFAAVLCLVQTFLEDPCKAVTGSHVAFDVEFLERTLNFHARVEGIYDTGIIWYEAAQYQQPSLKQLVAEQLDGYRYLVHEPHRCLDADLLLRYMAEDVAYAYRLFAKGMRQLKPAGRDLVARALGPMSLTYEEAHAHGLYVRQDYRAGKIAEYAERRRAEVEAWAAVDPDFVPVEHESGKGLADYLFRIKGLPVLGTTETGQSQVDKPAIRQWIRDGAAYLQHLLAIRELDKLSSTYLTAYDRHVHPDSRIRPKFWLTAVDTSRPSSSDPNVFNVPRAKEIRDLFGAPPGGVLVEGDLSQIEFRVMVCLAHDENGIAGYLRGDDAHTMTARQLTDNPTPTKEQRTLAKPVNFALLYAGDWPTLQRAAFEDYGLEWSEEKCREFVKGFFRTYPRIPEYQQACRQRLIDNKGWFTSATGHTYHYADWDAPDHERRDHAFRAALNSSAQGPAANLCYVIAANTRRALLDKGLTGVRIVNSVYDSVMIEVPDPSTVPDVIAALEEGRAAAARWAASWFGVPLVMEYATGSSWGSLEFWEK